MLKLLFICTHNRCRSILAEAITNHFGQGHLLAASAGSQPAGQVHPSSLRYLEERGRATRNLKSQSWDELEAFEPDVVITVCDSAANEVCPVWFGQCLKVHWGLPDPSRLSGNENDIRDAFYNVMATLEARIQRLLSDLPASSDSAALAEVFHSLANHWPTPTPSGA
ncbi:MAG: arsenate reductase ArsC [Anaerolineae bacterium]|nr:arsenate reductase ArsC [Anaerolineae bacterium]